MYEGAVRIHMQKHGTKCYNSPETTLVTPQVILFQDQKTGTACLNQMLSGKKKTKSYFLIKNTFFKICLKFIMITAFIQYHSEKIKNIFR